MINWDAVATTVMKSVLTVLVLGFFGLLWKGYDSIDSRIAKADFDQQITIDVVSEEMALLREEVERLTELLKPKEINLYPNMEEEYNDDRPEEYEPPKSLKEKIDVRQQTMKKGD